MKLSPEEELFLRHWMYEEFHYQDGPGPAKQLQLQHRAIPAELAFIIAAAIPDLDEQEAAGKDPPPVPVPSWPWTHETLQARVCPARAVLAQERKNEMAEGTVSGTPLTPAADRPRRER